MNLIIYEPTNDTRVTLSLLEGQQEGESVSRGSHMGSVLVSPSISSILVPPSVGSFRDNLVHSQGEEINNDSVSGSNNPCHGDIQSGLPSRDKESLMHEDPGTNSHSLSPNAPSSTLEQGDNQLSTHPTPENDQPIAVRKPIRSFNILEYLKDYKHDISNFISYEFCNPSF